MSNGCTEMLKGKGPLYRVYVDTLQCSVQFRYVYSLMVPGGFKTAVAKDFYSFMYFMIEYIWTILISLTKKHET